MRITIDTDCNAPGCPCQLVADDGRTHLVQSDWDYPGIASAFGWSVLHVQRCKSCGRFCTVLPLDEHNPGIMPVYFACQHCDELVQTCCEHKHTDGTVICPDCGTIPTAFIENAGTWLSDHDGATTDDPGYFSQE